MTVTADPDPDVRARWYQRPPLTPCALGLILLPFAVGVVVLVVAAGDYQPAHDIAQMELRIRDVGSHEVLLGPYSRDGWYHPGPAIFYLLAVPYRLTASSSLGLYLGGLVINAGSVVGMAVIARRRGGEPLMLITLLASGLLVMSLGADLVRDPWNPSVTVLPFGLMIFLTWAMTCGDRWAFPAGVVVASFVAQTHVGYTVLALPLLAWGAAWLVAPTVRAAWARRAAAGRWLNSDASAEDTTLASDLPPPRLVDSWRVLVKSVAIGGVLFVLLWAPPVVEQLTGSSGNLGDIAHWFRTSEESAHTLGDSWRVMSTQFSLTPDWITGTSTTALSDEPTALYVGPSVPVMLALIGIAGWFLWQRGDAAARRFLLTLLVAFALGFVAVTRTTGIAFAYRLQWVQVLGMTTGVVMGWGGWLALRPHLSPLNLRRTAGAALAGLVVLSTVSATDAARAGTPQQEWSPAIGGLTPDVLDNLGHESGPVLVRGGSFGAMLYATGLVLSLERAGIDARMPALTDAAGAHRTLQPDEAATTLVIATNEDVATNLANPDLDLMATWGVPPEPRPDDDPTARAEQAFVSGDVETLESLGRDYLDDPGLQMFETTTVAVFREAG